MAGHGRTSDGALEVDLRLRDSRTNCGCTTTDVAGLVIPARGSIHLPIHFDAQGRVGERSATVDLFLGLDRWRSRQRGRPALALVCGTRHEKQGSGQNDHAR
jgi:hypothetical protein